MNESAVIKKLIHIPIDFHSDGNTKSFNELVKASGFSPDVFKLSEKKLLDALKSKPRCIESWIQWSQDQRVAESWYILELQNGKYEVGYQSPTPQLNRIFVFQNAISAVAKYVHAEIKGSFDL